MSPNRSDPGSIDGVPWMDARIPAEKREPLRAAMVRAMQKVLIQQGALQAAQLGLADALQDYPLDRKAVQAQWQAVQAASDAILKVRIDQIAEEQKILGDALWKELHPRWRVASPETGVQGSAAAR
jgi:hypothetical protein